MEVKNLLTIMKVAGLSAQDIGQAFGYTAWQIYNIRQGKSTMPSDLVVKLSDLIHVSPAEFKSKDLSKLIKSMVIVINKLPDEKNDELVKQLKEDLTVTKEELLKAKNQIIELQSKLLEKR